MQTKKKAHQQCQHNCQERRRVRVHEEVAQEEGRQGCQECSPGNTLRQVLAGMQQPDEAQQSSEQGGCQPGGDGSQRIQGAHVLHAITRARDAEQWNVLLYILQLMQHAAMRGFGMCDETRCRPDTHHTIACLRVIATSETASQPNA